MLLICKWIFLVKMFRNKKKEVQYLSKVLSAHFFCSKIWPICNILLKWIKSIKIPSNIHTPHHYSHYILIFKIIRYHIYRLIFKSNTCFWKENKKSFSLSFFCFLIPDVSFFFDVVSSRKIFLYTEKAKCQKREKR